MTASRGYRATPQRVAELQANIAELRGEMTARVELLEAELRRVQVSLTLVLSAARLRAGVELQVARALEQRKPEPEE